MAYVLKRINDIVYSPPLEFSKNENKGLGHFFYTSFKKHGDKIFQIDGKTGDKETYSSILQKSIRTAMEMGKLGIKEGDNIVLCSTNCMNAIVPVMATSFLNAVIANLDPSLSLRDCVYLLNLVQPKMIFVEASAMELLEDIAKELHEKPAVVVMGHYTNKYLPFNQFLTKKHDEGRFAPAVVEDIDGAAVIFFSSGTTGMPKPVKCSHHGLLSSAYSLKQAKLDGRIVFHISSFYWISAYLLTLLAAECGGQKILASMFETKFFMELVQKYQLTYIFLPTNTAYQFTKENTSGYNTTSVQNLMFSGSVLNAEQLKKCKAYFPNALVSNAYGQSEASNYITAFTKDTTAEIADRHPGSCGVPVPGTNLKIVDHDTEEVLPPNKIGEVRVFSNQLFIGYQQQDASECIDSAGFLKTGDIGYINEDHCLYVVDRLKDMFKYKSWHIVPASVENVLYQHPGVKEAVVLGIPNEEDGDHPMALVVLHVGYSDVNEEDIQNFVNARVLEREKLRAGVKIISNFPRTVTGKIVRREIRKAVIEGRLQ